MGTWKYKVETKYAIIGKKKKAIWPLTSYTSMQFIAIALSYIYTKYEICNLRHWDDMNPWKYKVETKYDIIDQKKLSDFWPIYISNL